MWASVKQFVLQISDPDSFPLIVSFLYLSLLQDWHSYVDGLKLFSDHHGYDGVVVLLSINDTLHHPRHQVAVYSNNTDMLNQVNKNRHF